MKIGVYVCECGSNIAGTVDTDEVADSVKLLPNVVVSRVYKYECSDPGQELIRQDIEEFGLDKVVVAACSPSMHEPTFRAVLEDKGLNPYCLEMVNIREQCSWVHADKDKGTDKAVSLVKGAVMRSELMEPLDRKKVGVTSKALVIGGGIAGIQAALDIANSGYEVTLVEKKSTIGGKMAQLDKTFPTLDCSQCILSPKMVDVGRHPNITLYANSEVDQVDGYIGNFKVKIKRNPRYVIEDKCTLCDDCVPVCPVIVHDEYNENLSPRKAIYIAYPQAVPASYIIDPDNCLGIEPLICSKCRDVCGPEAIDFDMKEEIIEDEFGAIIVATGYELYPIPNIGEYGYGTIHDVISGLEFERILAANGPTAGVVRRPSDGKIPQAVVFIHCAGSRDPAKNLSYCSKICCMYAIKHALQYKHHVHDGLAVNFYIDIRTGGKDYEEFYKRAAEEEKVIFIRGKVSEVLQDGDRILIKGVNTLTAESIEMHADLVVLATGIQPSEGTKEVASMLKLSRDMSGFVKEAHPKLKPVETSMSGVYIAGTVSGP
ncbi:MAG: CoB--CoM heterodisulfide reductase iron-sulfur subunit A family protein, partial [Candidatus Heimdallarchaeota archaeon]|nr:CoB--CoM heterodisulfide reductase iron-sulfur subunit A family protein [Candidatus Heimdallarchaeota archaeon]MCK4878758.1 CoB--CoM heterodisulfide reductase iron-sulfur subunit A family protein [Candidatus Heimdallarchaeota archaeon]